MTINEIYPFITKKEKWTTDANIINSAEKCNSFSYSVLNSSVTELSLSALFHLWLNPNPNLVLYFKETFTILIETFR